MDSYEIINYIAQAERKTPVKAYIKGDISKIDFGRLDYYGTGESGVLFCEYAEWEEFLKKNEPKLEKHRIEMDRRNSAIPLADYSKYNSRIEPGVSIRDLVEIGANCVIMMGAVINIGAVIGEKTMIDMNVVIGGRAQVGKNCHIGAGAVIAGVIEPPSAEPVVIGDDVLVGANAVILEGVKIGARSVIAAGSVVISDIEPDSVVAGVPGKVIKKVNEQTKAKTQLIEALRRL